MNKTLILTILLAGLTEAKVRPLYPALGQEPTALVKAHDRLVRQPLVDSCSQAYVAAGHEPLVGSGTCSS